MKFVQTSMIKATILAAIVISSSVILATNIGKHHATPELDVYEWAKEDSETLPLMFGIHSTSDSVTEYGILLDNITDLHWNHYETQWRIRTESYDGIITTEYGIEQQQHYRSFITNETTVKAQFNTLRTAINTLPEYNAKLEVDFSDYKNGNDDWTQYEEFIVTASGQNTTKEGGSTDSNDVEPTQRIDPLIYIEFIGQQSERVLLMVYEFGISLAASTAQMELENGELVPVTTKYTDQIEYGENFGWMKSGYPSLDKGDIHNFYYIEYDLEDTRQLQFFTQLNGLLMELIQ